MEGGGAAVGPYVAIDTHTHILPQSWPNWKEKFGYGGFIYLEHHEKGKAKMWRDDGHFFREIKDNCWCGATSGSGCTLAQRAAPRS